jgi:ATP-dependent DNA ligase
VAARVKAGFVEPMLLLPTDALPDEPARWEYQLKFDGYRAIAFKTGGEVHLRSRNNNDFSRRYRSVLEGLTSLPNETVIDGELVALDDEGRPSFNALQNQAGSTPVLFYVFDVMVLSGRDLKAETLEVRRELLEQKVVPKLTDPVRYAGELSASLRDLVLSVKAHAWRGSSPSGASAGTSRAGDPVPG